MAGDLVLRFGRCRGLRIRDVEEDYLRYLCSYDVFVDSSDRVRVEDRDHDGQDGTAYMWRCQRPVINAAREYAKDRRLCLQCFRPLVPIGHSS